MNSERGVTITIACYGIYWIINSIASKKKKKDRDLYKKLVVLKVWSSHWLSEENASPYGREESENLTSLALAPGSTEDHTHTSNRPAPPAPTPKNRMHLEIF